MENTNNRPTNNSRAEAIKAFSKLQSKKISFMPNERSINGFPENLYSIENFSCQVCGNVWSTILATIVKEGCPKCEHDRLGIFVDQVEF